MDIRLHLLTINYSLITIHSLERISNSEMQGLALTEAGYIEIARLACIVRTVDGQAPIETDNQEAHIVTQTDTGAYCKLIDKLLKRLRIIAKVGIIIITLEVPYVPASRNIAPLRSPKSLVRYSRLVTNLASPFWNR